MNLFFVIYKGPFLVAIKLNYYTAINVVFYLKAGSFCIPALLVVPVLNKSRTFSFSITYLSGSIKEFKIKRKVSGFSFA